VHTGPGPAFRLWTLFAAVAGGLFGALTVWRGNLLAPMVAHFVVNAVNLWRVSAAHRRAGKQAS
jgi:membrane protease YdiL (CAAX protease family)